MFGREPGSLRNIYASAGRGFLHDMLVAAGGEDVLNDIEKESAQVSTETILARKPDVILELNAANRLNDADLKAVVDPWMTLSSVPAVRNKRVIVLNGPGLTVPARASSMASRRWRRRFTMRRSQGAAQDLSAGRRARIPRGCCTCINQEYPERRGGTADDDEPGVRSRRDARGQARAARSAG